MKNLWTQGKGLSKTENYNKHLIRDRQTSIDREKGWKQESSLS